MIETTIQSAKNLIDSNPGAASPWGAPPVKTSAAPKRIEFIARVAISGVTLSSMTIRPFTTPTPAASAMQARTAEAVLASLAV